VVTAQFVDTLAGILTQGARVYCCSDVRPLAAEMQALFLAKQGSFAIDEGNFRSMRRDEGTQTGDVGGIPRTRKDRGRDRGRRV
jgi:tRNA G46 methylase TrmB